MKSIFLRFFRPKPTLGRVETMILDAVRAQLSPLMAGRCAAQIASLIPLDRAPGRRLVNFRLTTPGSSHSGADIAFPFGHERMRLATLILSLPGGFTPLRAEVHCQDGILSSIEYHDDSEWMEEAVRRGGAQHILVDCALAPGIAGVMGPGDPLTQGAA